MDTRLYVAQLNGHTHTLYGSVIKRMAGAQPLCTEAGRRPSPWCNEPLLGRIPAEPIAGRGCVPAPAVPARCNGAIHHPDGCRHPPHHGYRSSVWLGAWLTAHDSHPSLNLTTISPINPMFNSATVALLMKITFHARNSARFLCSLAANARRMRRSCLGMRPHCSLERSCLANIGLFIRPYNVCP